MKARATYCFFVLALLQPTFSNSNHISNLTDSSCEFEPEEKCKWDWDRDNFTDHGQMLEPTDSWPGQDGFYRMTGIDVSKFYNMAGQVRKPGGFFGPLTDRRGSNSSSFLYLLGKPASSNESVSDKRLISSFMRESGNNCTLELIIAYQNILGMNIEVGTQTQSKAYTPITNKVIQKKNQTTHGWARLIVTIGRYLDPFLVSVDIRRSNESRPGSFIAIDSASLRHCSPEESQPIDCSAEIEAHQKGLKLHSHNYVCPGGEGVTCQPAASVLCDFESNCPNHGDEREDFCALMPRAARCDFNHEKDLCGWYDPMKQFLLDLSSPKKIWSRRNGTSKLAGVDGDLSLDGDGHYLQVDWRREDGQAGLRKGAVLRSPIFPPPPKYNNDQKDPRKRNYYRSCVVRMHYHANSATLVRGSLELWIKYYNDSSENNGFVPQFQLTSGIERQSKNRGWTRWEVAVPTFPQLRYSFNLVGLGGLGSQTELAVDDFSLSPQCFGLGVPEDILDGWRYNMTDEEFCHYYGRTGCDHSWKSVGYTLTTCGQTGALGPSESQCHEAYATSATRVQIGDNQISGSETHRMGFTTGIQRWTVPRSDLYTFVVRGASGAAGRLSKASGMADEIRALVPLKQNETIFIAVGQTGLSYCEINGIVSNVGRCSSTTSTYLHRKKRSHPRSPKKYEKHENIEKIAKMVRSDDQQRNRLRYNVEPSAAETSHGQIHHGPDTRTTNGRDHLQDVYDDTGEIEGIGGGGGGGATIIFRMLEGSRPQPILIAGGGGGGADKAKAGGQHDRMNARGFVNPNGGLENWLRLVPSADNDGGSGGGWNATFSTTTDYDKVMDDLFNHTMASPNGFSSEHSWMGGVRCQVDSHQFGGFGGGGGGCRGGGGGGGFIGGRGGSGEFESGDGGWSYYNKEVVLQVFDANSVLRHPSLNRIPQPWKWSGQGQVRIIPPLYNMPCQANCSEVGAFCMALDETISLYACICPNGKALDFHNPKCTPEKSLLMIVGLVFMTFIAFAVCGLLCMYLHSQYQLRRHKLLDRRKLPNAHEGQLSRIRNGANGIGGIGIGGSGAGSGAIMLTEYNPNYAFGGGMCTMQDLKEIPRESLRLVKALGQGAFGEVYQGLYKKSPTDPMDMPVAVKTLPELSSNQAEMDFLMEALIMSKFNHGNIVHFIGVCFDKHPRFIVLELLAGGDLKNFLRDSRPKPDRASPLVMKDLLMCAMDVAKGCEYLEENHFIHRDIAARNCLLTTAGPGRIVKIADFGMARDIYRADYYRKGGKTLLPVKWMPPEAFLDGIFTSKTDVWSFGILLWEVMSLGYMPYPGRGNQEVMQLVTNGGRLEPPNYCPGPVYGLMTQCWHPIPEERPNFRTILERLGYCMQDPEVVMAPLPISHRPLSIESRDNSMSNSSRGPVDSSADSGSGFSLPMRSQRTSSTPDSPSTLNGTLGASNDYLVPTTSTVGPPKVLPAKPPNWQQSLGSPDDPEVATSETQPMIRSTSPMEAETSFTTTHSPHQRNLRSRAGRIANKAYGLTNRGIGGNSGGLSGSKSTQPLLDSSPTLELPPVPVISHNAAVDSDGCPTGPLPPTPTDQPSSSIVSPATPIALDAASLRPSALAMLPPPPGGNTPTSTTSFNIDPNQEHNEISV